MFNLFKRKKKKNIRSYIFSNPYGVITDEQIITLNESLRKDCIKEFEQLIKDYFERHPYIESLYFYTVSNGYRNIGTTLYNPKDEKICVESLRFKHE